MTTMNTYPWRRLYQQAGTAYVLALHLTFSFLIVFSRVIETILLIRVAGRAASLSGKEWYWAVTNPPVLATIVRREGITYISKD